jgi:pyruvate, orthophosphate dikinase
VTAAKWVYAFGAGRSDGKADMKNLLGGKGANLAEMASLGLPVPPGFTITTDVCTYYYDNSRAYPPALQAQVADALAAIGTAVGATFGDASNPLLVSVRSGARASMPGMMDTILNLGLNDATVEGLAKKSGDARFAYDSYRRFITMYSNVVLDVGHHYFEDILENHKNLKGYDLDTDLTADDWKALIPAYKKQVETKTGKPFPQDTPGKTTAPSPIAASMTSRTPGAPPSTCKPWCLATWANRRQRALPSRAIHRPAKRPSTASSWSTHRVRTSSPAFARRRT